MHEFQGPAQKAVLVGTENHDGAFRDGVRVAVAELHEHGSPR
jgi:hypothetical protein